MVSLALEACVRTKTVVKYVQVPCNAGVMPEPPVTHTVKEDCPLGYTCYTEEEFRTFTVWVYDMLVWGDDAMVCIDGQTGV